MQEISKIYIIYIYKLELEFLTMNEKGKLRLIFMQIIWWSQNQKKRKAKKKIKNIKKEKVQNPLRSFVNINIIIKYIMLYYYSMMAFKTNFFLFLNDLKI